MKKEQENIGENLSSRILNSQQDIGDDRKFGSLSWEHEKYFNFLWKLYKFQEFVEKVTLKNLLECDNG
jgi:hypothetical protein